MAERYWLETLGCPKNQVDSDKLEGLLWRAGFEVTESPEDADLVVVNTCAFIEEARQESVDTILDLSRRKSGSARLVVTGCLAERYGDELAAAMPEIDLVAGFGEDIVSAATAGARVPAVSPDEKDPGSAARGVAVGTPTRRRVLAFDLLELPRPPATAPWAYVKIAEGCDRRCAYCAIPSFRGAQRSRDEASVLSEIEALGPEVQEIVLVAQDLASWALDRTGAERSVRDGSRPVVDLIKKVAKRVERVRLLYLYPSSVDVRLVEAMCETGVPYFDLSLQHVSKPLLRRMHRPGHAAKFMELISRIRAIAPDAAMRSSFILGFPGETEEDHDELLRFLEEAQLDWGGFFTFSEEPGTAAASMEQTVDRSLAIARLREASELQDAITARRRDALIGTTTSVLVDAKGTARSYREAPEIDGVVHVPDDLAPGTLVDVLVNGSAGPDLWAEPLGLAGVA